jgi:hypothetical protein
VAANPAEDLETALARQAQVEQYERRQGEPRAVGVLVFAVTTRTGLAT